MKVVILAAGNSMRLISLTKDRPKCLLPINNSTILGKELNNIRRVGLTDVIISGGYKIEQIEDYVNKHNNGLKIQVEFNPFFDISNNIMSLWNIRHLIAGAPIIIINGDNLFDFRILKLLLAAEQENVLMVNIKPEYDGDDMKVMAEEGMLKAVNKSMASSVASAESIGIMKFSAVGCGNLLVKLDEMSRIKENHQVWYLRAIQELADEGLPINICDINGLAWEEVDFPLDYDKVRMMNWD